MERNLRKTRVGLVTSDKMNKTIVVTVTDNVKHPLYNKIVKRSYKLKAHDENNEAGIGDRVRVMETRPLSKDKRWRLVEIVDRSMTAVPHMVWDPDERKKVHDGDWVFDAGNAIKALHELAVQVGYAKGETETTEQRKSFEDWLAEQNKTSRL